MKDEIKKHAEIMSKILKVDVEIVDSRLNRIAGKIHTPQSIDAERFIVGNIYKEVIATKQRQIIWEPREHPLCLKCDLKGVCNEKFEMSTPILDQGEILGVIGFVCFTEEQKSYIESNFDIFSDFLDQMAGLISLKARQMKENDRMRVVANLMSDVFEKIEECVLVFNKHDQVIRMNASAKALFNVTEDMSDYHEVTLENSHDTFEGREEYRLKYQDEEYPVVGRFIHPKSDGFHKLFLFSDINKIKASAAAIMSSNEKIGVKRLYGDSKQVVALRNTIKRIADTSSSVMIIGESGTGKELVARALHEESVRANYPFVAINCAAVPENLLESELFGYIKGAFTGADPKGKIGKFELAHKGTLFLDEVGDMPLHIQVKLLRVLEEREIVRLGSNKSTKINVRIIAATNKNLEVLIKENLFREDLFYRLNVIPLKTMPLRSRDGDTRMLAEYFIARYAGIFGKKILGTESSFWDALEQFNWPGNVRELQNTIEYAINIVTTESILKLEHLPEKLKAYSSEQSMRLYNLADLEKMTIKNALDHYGDDGPSKKKVAVELGIGIATLYRKMKVYNLE